MTAELTLDEREANLRDREIELRMEAKRLVRLAADIAAYADLSEANFKQREKTIAMSAARAYEQGDLSLVVLNEQVTEERNALLLEQVAPRITYRSDQLLSDLDRTRKANYE